MATDNREMELRVLAIAERIMRERGIDRTPDLESPLTEDGLGLDSMARLDLLQEVEEVTGVNIPERYWDGHGLKNLRDAARIVSKLVS